MASRQFAGSQGVMNTGQQVTHLAPLSGGCGVLHRPTTVTRQHRGGRFTPALFGQPGRLQSNPGIERIQPGTQPLGRGDQVG
jgi:hypothetical protein